MLFGGIFLLFRAIMDYEHLEGHGCIKARTFTAFCPMVAQVSCSIRCLGGDRVLDSSSCSTRSPAGAADDYQTLAGVAMSPA